MSRRVPVAVCCLLGAVLTIAAGCATPLDPECPRTDWLELGRADGLAGRAPRQLSGGKAACAERGSQPDGTAYARGWAEGLNAFCTPARGLEVGRSGGGYDQVCPPAQEAGFLKGYRVGRRIFETRIRIDEVRAEMRANAKLLEKPDSTEPRKGELMERNKRLARELARHEAMLVLHENIAIPGSY